MNQAGGTALPLCIGSPRSALFALARLAGALSDDLSPDHLLRGLPDGLLAGQLAGVHCFAGLTHRLRAHVIHRPDLSGPSGHLPGFAGLVGYIDAVDIFLSGRKEGCFFSDIRATAGPGVPDRRDLT